MLGLLLAVVVIVDGNGEWLRACESPVDLDVQNGGIICRAPVTIFGNGFE